MYPNGFNQDVDESSQEEDEGQDAGPLHDDLLVRTQDLEESHSHLLCYDVSIDVSFPLHLFPLCVFQYSPTLPAGQVNASKTVMMILQTGRDRDVQCVLICAHTRLSFTI